MTEMQFGKGLMVVIGVYPALQIIALARNSIGQRHVIFWYLGRFVACSVTFIVIILFLVKIGLRGWWIQYVALFISVLWLFPKPRKRSRRIPLEMRRKIIQLFEKRTGIQYDPKVHHIDHKVPFAMGGGHTMDNLRVVPLHVNRMKGGKFPWFEDWLRMWTGRG